MTVLVDSLLDLATTELQRDRITDHTDLLPETATGIFRSLDPLIRLIAKNRQAGQSAPPTVTTNSGIDYRGTLLPVSTIENGLRRIAISQPYLDGPLG